MKQLVATLAVALLFSAGSAWADWGDGVAAWERSDYATAFREWLPLAEQGNARAQYNLDFMYENSYGVAKNRGIMEGGMSDVQLAQAQKLAREWKPE
jgi:TPR repeat protein